MARHNPEEAVEEAEESLQRLRGTAYSMKHHLGDIKDVGVEATVKEHNAYAVARVAVTFDADLGIGSASIEDTRQRIAASMVRALQRNGGHLTNVGDGYVEVRDTRMK